jgi:flagellar hook-associated protein 2
VFRAEVGKNPGAAVDAIRSFVDSYNTLIRDITLGMLTERPSSGHHFLTDFDIEEMGMTELQVTQWNAMANKGLMFNNRTISTIMNNMRNAMNTIVGGFGIHNIVGNDGTHAIRPSQNWREMGQIEFNEQALLEALERDPEKIMQLFTGENGIMNRMHDELHRALNSMGPESTHGTLVRRAGMPTGLTASRNALFERIKSINDSINVMQARHDRQQERFWRMFTNMERQFASLNSQSDQINGFFMGLFA